MKKYLVTSALPYANGPLHFGHIAGVYLPADIFTRHKKIMGEKIIHISGSDEHGVAIMLSAEKQKIDYQTYVDQWHESHQKLFQKYGIEFDYFGRTSSEYHREEVLKWFNELNKNHFIEKRPEKQLYCNSCTRFLPDRYVEGTCYNCNYSPARGDECPNCGEWIEALRLKEPSCKICNQKNIAIKESDHWYLLLTKLKDRFLPWFNSKKHWRSHVWGYVNSLVEQGLVDRAITRDLSWGIDVPLPEAKGKKLYVWFDAPIGYVSNTKKWLAETNSKENYLTDWWQNKDTQIVHFIGKDNIIFHALIWPSMVLGTGFVEPPTEVPANHFVNLEGKQFSKSAGWYVESDLVIDAFGQDALRFYLASLVPETGDTNFSWESFLNLYNELSNKIGNFVNRSMSFLAKHWPEGLSAQAMQSAMSSDEINKIELLLNDYRAALDGFWFQKAQTHLLRLGEMANEHFHLQEPWKTVKTDKAKAEVTLAVSVIYSLTMASVFRPFLPEFCKKLAKYFPEQSSDLVLGKFYRFNKQTLGDCFKNGYQLTIKPEPLFKKIEPQQIDPFRLIKK